MLFWLSVVLFITSSMYTVISGNPRSHTEYLVDSVNPVPKQVPRNCRNSKWSSLTWHLAHSASAFVTNQLIWISLNQRTNSIWWGRTWKVWGRTRYKVGANSKGRTRCMANLHPPPSCEESILQHTSIKQQQKRQTLFDTLNNTMTVTRKSLDYWTIWALSWGFAPITETTSISFKIIFWTYW